MFVRRDDEIKQTCIPGAASGWGLVADERMRQVATEGFEPRVDDEWRSGELAKAAACYLADPEPGSPMPKSWPWRDEPCSWKPKDRIRNLVRAGALIAAEIDRLNRSNDDEESTP